MKNLSQHFNVIDGVITYDATFIEALIAVREILENNFVTDDEIVYATGCDYDRAREMLDRLNYLRWALAD